MEHRYSKRVATNIKVLIYKAGLPMAIGRITDIGKHGMFVQCLSSDFAVHQPLVVELLIPGKASNGASRFKCNLMHMSNGGLGLAVHEDSITAYNVHTAPLVFSDNRNSAGGIS